MKNFLNIIKSYATKALAYYKEKGDFKIIAFGGIIGLLTFSSWAAFFLFILTLWVYYLAKKTVPQTITSFVTLDYNKYILNTALGLIISSLFLLIV